MKTMAKLYAELTSDKGGRTVSKCGDKKISMYVEFKNKTIYEVHIEDDGQDAPAITVTSEGECFTHYTNS